MVMPVPADDDALHDDCATTVLLRRAAEAHDVDSVVATFAAGVILRSPITSRVVFRGRDDVRDVLAAVFAIIEEIRYVADVGDQRTRALFYRARVGREPLEEGMRLHLDEHGDIDELTIFFRPMPGLASLAAALAPRVARKHGRVRSFVARALLSPLALATRLGDRLVPWLT